MKTIGAWLVFLFGEYCMVTNALPPSLYDFVRIGNIAVAGLVAVMVVGPFFGKRQNVGKELKLIIGGACLVVFSILEVVICAFVWRANYPAT